MLADTTTVPANLAVRAALDVCQVLRHERAVRGGPLGIETLVTRTGLEPNLVLWGIRVLEDEGLVEVESVSGETRIVLHVDPTGCEA